MSSLFRYVPQIEQAGLDVDPLVLQLLADRDRQLEDFLSDLATNPPVSAAATCTLRRDTAFNVADAGGVGTYTTMTWTVEDSDPLGMWSSGDPTKIYAKAEGPHLVDCFAIFATNTAGTFRNMDVLLNGTQRLQIDSRPPIQGTGDTSVSFAFTVDLDINDYLVFRFTQNSGGALALRTTGDELPRVSVCYLGTRS